MVTPTRAVMCNTAGCANEGVAVTVPDDGSAVECGVCGTEIAEQAGWYEPPVPPSPDPVAVALAIAAMSPEERAALSALLAPLSHGPASRDFVAPNTILTPTQEA